MFHSPHVSRSPLLAPLTGKRDSRDQESAEKSAETALQREREREEIDRHIRAGEGDMSDEPGGTSVTDVRRT